MLHVMDHPLVSHWLTELRCQDTPPSRFRGILKSLSAALFLEASRDLPTATRRVETPLAPYEGRWLEGVPVLAPILRAGLGMAEGILDLAAEARTCHIGIYREHASLQAVPYYPPTHPHQELDLCGSRVFVLDPMLATGGSAVAALQILERWNSGPARLLGIVGAPEGVAHVQEHYPGVAIHLCALDERLNERGYIVPGLGDAGDRQFGP